MKSAGVAGRMSAWGSSWSAAWLVAGAWETVDGDSVLFTEVDDVRVGAIRQDGGYEFAGGIEVLSDKVGVV